LSCRGKTNNDLETALTPFSDFGQRSKEQMA
jgi:hypothetical protein